MKGKIKKDIYIIKNTENNMCYIGQSIDYKTRFKKHCEEARRKKYTYKSYLYNAMNEIGIENFYVELLERQIEDYNEKEEYYIKKYNTLRPNGYNLTKGGEGFPCLEGVLHYSATIKSQEILTQIYNKLLNSNLTLREIGENFEIPEGVISNINQGKSYRNEHFTYPIRQNHISKEQLDRLTYDLKYSNYKYNELAKIYNLSISQIKTINMGRSWYRDYLRYPLRKMCFSGKDVEKEKIQKDLLSTSLTFLEIGEKYGCSISTVRRINKGEAAYNKNLKYPLRKNEKITAGDLQEIYRLLKTDTSINEIAKIFSVSDATIKRINKGETKKYRINNYSYPIRPINPVSTILV